MKNSCKCRHCGNYGCRVGTWLSWPRKRRWAVMTCVRKTCRFKFQTLDYPNEPSIERAAQPRWMVPEHELIGKQQ